MSTIREQALACRDAAQVVAALDSTAKRALLRDMAAALEAQSAIVLAANAEDMRQAVAKGVQSAMLDRLRLDETRVTAGERPSGVSSTSVRSAVETAALLKVFTVLPSRARRSRVAAVSEVRSDMTWRPAKASSA